MARLIDDFGGPLPLEPDSRGRPPDLYGALLRSITGQQLSVKAARAIYGRLTERFGGGPPAPPGPLARRPPPTARGPPPPPRRRPRSCSPTTPSRCAPPPASAGRRSSRCARWPSM